MILGAGPLQLPAIKKAKEMGLYVITVDRDMGALGFSFADKSLEISTNDIDRVVEAAAEYRIDAIMTLATDLPVRTVAAVVERQGLVGVSVDTAFKTTDKILMRETLRECNVPVPKFFKCVSEEEFLNAVKQIGAKCVCKPADSSGSRGVCMVSQCDTEDLLSDVYHYCHKYSISGEVIVEDYMEGHEVSVESVSVNDEVFILAVTDKITTGPPHFVEIGHSQPSLLSSSEIAEIETITKAAVRALGIRNSASHAEIIVTDNGPKIVEIGARMGGDHIATHLVPLSTGIDMVKACIEIALGEKPSLMPKWNKGSAIRYIETGTGIVSDILGINNAEAIPGVIQVSIVCDVGEYVGEIKSSIDRAGFVIAHAENAVKAIQIAEAGCSEIQIVF